MRDCFDTEVGRRPRTFAVACHILELVKIDSIPEKWHDIPTTAISISEASRLCTELAIFGCSGRSGDSSCLRIRDDQKVFIKVEKATRKTRLSPWAMCTEIGWRIFCLDAMRSMSADIAGETHKSLHPKSIRSFERPCHLMATLDDAGSSQHHETCREHIRKEGLKTVKVCDMGLGCRSLCVELESGAGVTPRTSTPPGHPLQLQAYESWVGVLLLRHCNMTKLWKEDVELLSAGLMIRRFKQRCIIVHLR